MKQGFEIELSCGTILKTVPKAGCDSCAISYGDTKIEIDVKNASFRVVAPAEKDFSVIPTIVRFESKEMIVKNFVSGSSEVKGPHTMRTCHNCNDKPCCVTNMCADCGCGWICDP